MKETFYSLAQRSDLNCGRAHRSHEAALECVVRNCLSDGDRCGLCAQDHNPTLWFSEDGSRVGTYNGHNGAVNTCDVTSE